MDVDQTTVRPSRLDEYSQRRTQRGSAFRVGVVLALVAAVCVGCRAPQVVGPGAPRTIIARWIQEDPGGSVDPDRLFRRHEKAAVTFRDTADLEAVWLRGAGEVEVVDGVLEVRGLAEDSAILLDIACEAHEVTEIVVDVRPFGRGRLGLEWEGSGGTGQLAMDSNAADRDEWMSFRFGVGGDRRWTGSIRRLTIRPRLLKTNVLRIHRIRLLERKPDGDALETAMAGMRHEIAHVVRPALPAVPGRDHVLEISDLPNGAVARFAVGIDPVAESAYNLALVARSSGGELTELWSARLEPGEGFDGWQEVSVSLPTVAGGGVTLRLVTQGAAPGRGLAWWADPTVVAPADEVLPPVIVILLDTLRADRMSAYGAEHETTPFLRQWAASEAVLFEHVVAPAPWTLPAHASLFSGLDAVRHGVNHHMQSPDALDNLAEILRDAGYTTHAVTGGGILRPHYGFAQGFDSFAYWTDQDSTDEFEWGLERAAEVLERYRGQPVMLFFHTYEIHYPHRRRQPHFDRLAAQSGADVVNRGAVKMLPPEMDGVVSAGNTFAFRERRGDDWSTPLTPRQIRTVRLMYDSAIAYVDAGLVGLFDDLSRLGLRDGSVIVVTSDHGEALGEDQRAGHSFLDDYNLMVPLIVRFPNGIGAGARVPRQVRLIDVMPTIVDAVGLPVPGDVDGRSLVTLVNDPTSSFPEDAMAYAASSNRGVALRRGNARKLIFNDAAWRRVWGETELRELPGERLMVGPDDARDLQAMEQRVVDRLAGTFAGIRVELDNPSSGVLEGRLVGAWNTRSGVKAADASCACVRWAGGTGRIRLDRGQRVELLIANGQERIGGLSGRFVAEDGSEIPMEVSVDGRSLGGVLDYELVDGVFIVVGDGLGPGTGGPRIRILRSGPAPEADEDSLLTADAVSQLQALGYLQ